MARQCYAARCDISDSAVSTLIRSHLSAYSHTYILVKEWTHALSPHRRGTLSLVCLYVYLFLWVSSSLSGALLAYSLFATFAQECGATFASSPHLGSRCKPSPLILSLARMCAHILMACLAVWLFGLLFLRQLSSSFVIQKI